MCSRRVKVASGKLVFQYRTKIANGPKCGDCGRKLSGASPCRWSCRWCGSSADVDARALAGIAHLRPKEYRTISKRQKVVSRAYGGNRCHTCVRDRVVRAFLVEERKIVKNVLKQKLAQRAAATQAQEK